jgi:hypothetical protein
MDVFKVTVGFTTARPVQPDAQFAFFVVAASSKNDADLTAVAMLMTDSRVQMPTSIHSVKVS